MSLNDLPIRSPPVAELETTVRRVDRGSPQPDKITRAEELRLQLADEIVRGALAPGAPLDEWQAASSTHAPIAAQWWRGPRSND